MEITTSFDYGDILISSSIMAGFIGFSVFFSSKFAPELYISNQRAKIFLVYLFSAAIIVSQVGIIISVIMDWYHIYLHLTVLLLTSAFTVLIARHMLALRTMEAGRTMWESIVKDEEEKEDE